MIQIVNLLIVTFSFSTSVVWAHEGPHPAQETLASLNVIDPLINEIITIRPVKDHHFNLEAPQDCGVHSTINPAAKVISCQFHKSGERRVKVSVCDNKKSYCKAETLKVNVRGQAAKTARMKAPIAQPTQEMQNKMKKQLLSDFHFVTPEQARAEVKNKKGILALVSTEWCPPCNVIKEFMMQSQSFKDATKDYLLVYVDGDSTAFDSWKTLLQSYFFPTFVLLNKKLEVVDVKSGDIYFDNFNQWLTRSAKDLNDPLWKLEKRLNARLAKSRWQQMLDLFVTDEQKQQDELRWMDVLEYRNQTEQLVAFLEALSADRYKSKLLRAKYRDAKIGRKSEQHSPEEQKELLNQLGLEILSQPVEMSEPDYLYYWLVMEYCMDKKEVGGIPCDQALNTGFQGLKKFYSDNSQLLPLEAKMYELNLALYEAEGKKIMGDSEVAAQLYEQCQKIGKELAAQSPLGEKSRAVAITRLSCLKNTKGNETFELFQSMIASYPYDTTFHSALADYHFTKKDFVKALAANEKAVQYAYGEWWAKSINQRVRILKQLQKDQEALQLIEQSLQEISLDEGDYKQSWLNSWRSSLADLRKKVNL